MSYYCNKHKASTDACQDCFDESINIIKYFLKNDFVYQNMLGWKLTPAYIAAEQFLSLIKNV